VKLHQAVRMSVCPSLPPPPPPNSYCVVCCVGYIVLLHQPFLFYLKKISWPSWLPSSHQHHTIINTHTHTHTHITLEESPSWEANSRSPSEEISRLLWNPKVHYRFHNSPLLVPILSQMNKVHNSPLCVSKIHFNIIFPFTRFPHIQYE
jgi:hypothetical protein